MKIKIFFFMCVFTVFASEGTIADADVCSQDSFLEGEHFVSCKEARAMEEQFLFECALRDRYKATVESDNRKRNAAKGRPVLEHLIFVTSGTQVRRRVI